MDIILVAGLWLDGRAWDPVVPELEKLGHHPVPLTLPGQGDGAVGATLEDQVGAVLAAIDAAEKPCVVGHSAACALAWIAADRRPDAVSSVALVGGFPSADGEVYAPPFPIVDGGMPFPGWEPFEGPDSADLDDATKERMAAEAIPVPEGVARGTVHLTDERRYSVPVTLICPEFTPAQAREWIESGELPELTRAEHVKLVDLDTGHWPMFSDPAGFAGVITEAAEAHSA
jgi:pimeloyl-ACP methyl ester carboxylesterase